MSGSPPKTWFGVWPKVVGAIILHLVAAVGSLLKKTNNIKFKLNTKLTFSERPAGKRALGSKKKSS